MLAIRSTLKRFSRLLIISGILASLAGSPEPASAVSYMFASATGTMANACSYTDPCNLQKAVDSASPGGLVFVAEGTYHAYAELDDQVLLINKRVNIFGGWDGISGPDPVLDHKNKITILDGESERRVVTAIGLGTDQAQLYGFTLRNGDATGLYLNCFVPAPAGCGGGIFVSDISLTIDQCVIEDNVAAATYSASEAIGYGGGVYSQDSSGVRIQNSIIRSNDASTATSSGGGVRGKGGGIYVTGSAAAEDLVITDNEISDNNSAPAGVFYGQGGGLVILDSYGEISKNYIHDNNPEADVIGSGLYAENSNLSISANRIINNNREAVLYLSDHCGTLSSNIIDNPEAYRGIYLYGNQGGRFSVLVNNVIAHHSNANIYMIGFPGSGVTANMYHNTLDASLYGLHQAGYASSIVGGNIISNHSTGIYKNPSGTNMSVYVSYTLFYNNTSNGTWDSLIHPVASGNPAYVDAANGNYHIRTHSAARDVAESSGYSVDFDGNPRPIGSGVTPYDVGADEFWGWFLPMLQKH